MLYQPPVGGASNDPYVTGVIGVTPGSIPPGESIEHPQREIINVITAAGLTPSAADLTQLLAALKIVAGQPGDFKFVTQSSAPAGWLKANGAVISQTTYASLYAVIGTTFNTGGEGAGNFRLPDCRGEFIRGWDDARGVDSGRVFGSYQGGTLVVADFDATPSALTMYDTTGTYQSRYDADPVDTSLHPAATTYMSGLSGASVQSGSTSMAYFGTSRSRNLALLPCIKY